MQITTIDGFEGDSGSFWGDARVKISGGENPEKGGENPLKNLLAWRHSRPVSWQQTAPLWN